MKITPLVAGLGILALAPLGRAQTAADLTVNSDKVVKQIDDKLYGHFLEHIYHSLNGGLWGEVVWNRSFEEGLPRPAGARGGGQGRQGGAGPQGAAQTPPAPPAPPPGGTVIRHWMLVGTPEVTADTDRPLNSEKSLKLVTASAGTGVAQNNFYLRQGDVNRGSIWVRGESAGGMAVRFVEGDKVLAEQSLPAPGADWKEYPLALNPTATSKGATLQIVAKGPATVWIDQVSLMPDSYRATGGFRPDLLQAVADIRPGSIRWPGGSYVGTNGGYHWKGGIGPQSKRVGKVGWDELDPSSFGTDEFMALCRKVGAEPVLVVYLGARTPGADHSVQIQDAADWVEYCNGPATSKWGAVRAANGHPEPYRVKYWEIDNEIWSMNPADYVGVVHAFMAAMKKVDPSITGIACGSGGFGARFGDGDMAVIADASDAVDYLSIHHYENAARWAEGPATADAYFNKLGEAIAHSKNPNFRLYMSEWNLRTSIDWQSGLYAGGLLNTMERNPYVTMACPALWLRHNDAPNWDNAFINFDQSSWFPAPNYVVMKLYRDHFAPDLLELSGDAAGLNATATKSADGRRLVLKAVNPSDQPRTVKLTVTGTFRPARAGLQVVAPNDLAARNSFDHRDAVKAVTGSAERSGNQVTFTLPRWSVGVLELGN
ncbi:MAG TPA: alpha-L-arabinofuranosidase C-terminal domain-containing protein [Opitutaceae bacterium]|nr:alpha-L-arabinofuranosidase C-terminal domain-containing protein [Opitutaceae bacterium]